MILSESVKTIKGEGRGYMTAVTYLAPSTTSGLGDLCPKAGACKAWCLYTSGQLGLPAGILAQRERTTHLFESRAAFLDQLAHELTLFQARARRDGYVPCYRPNGTSDLPWLGLWAARTFPELQVYDYTKLPKAYARATGNYHLTFSWDPGEFGKDNWTECRNALAHGLSVAVTFAVKNRRSQHNGRPLENNPLPDVWRGFPVLDGDKTDLRFLDMPGHIVGLRAKGQAIYHLEKLANPMEVTL